MNKLEKYRKIIWIICSAIIILAGAFIINQTIRISTNALTDRKNEKAFEAWLLDPDNITITNEFGQDITVIFFERYGAELQAHKFKNALREFKEQKYSYTVAITEKTEGLFMP